ncbi:MAG: Gfo/Idh/MocA family oxidoreductase [Spirochaetota bacterium]
MRVGLIGMGVMGRNHYRVLNTIPEAELVAVCDERLPLDLPERVYLRVEEMLEEETLDAVVIAVPTSSHLEVASKVIDAGVPVLVEKPLASTVAEGHELVDLAGRIGVRAVVGHVERFNPVVRSLIHELEDKEIYSINITRIGPFPPRINDVGVLVDLSVHDIDLVHCLTGGVALSESRIYKSIKRTGNREDNAVISMRLENDVVANITTNWLTPFKKRTIEVAADRAFYTADLMSQELTEYSDYTESNSFVVRSCRVVKSEPLLGELRAFLHFASTGDRGGLASLEDGLWPLEVIGRERCDVPAYEGASVFSEAAAR